MPSSPRRRTRDTPDGSKRRRGTAASSPLPGLEASVHAFVARAPYDIGEHEHPFVEVLMITAGRTRVIVDDRAYDAGPGDLVVFHPRRRHSERVDAGRFRYACVRFHEELLEGAGMPTATATPPVIRAPWPWEFMRLAERIAAESEATDAEGPVIARAALTQFVALLRRALAKPPGPGRRAGASFDHTLDHTLQALHALEALEAQPSAGIGSLRTSRAVATEFRRLTGTTPKRYQLRARIAAAQRSLRETSAPIAAIAREHGFSNPQYFIRRFQLECGSTPGAYRRRTR